MGDIVRDVPAFHAQGVVSTALDAVRQDATTNRMSIMPTIPYETLFDTSFARPRCAPKAVA
jgi:hypothetical protein